jgi:MYXO-CTERM domain-containing protein
MRVLALAAAVLLVFPAAASAHVEMSPDRVDPGSFTLFTVLSPNESEQPLSALRLTIPSGMEVDGAAATPGFTTQLVRDQSHRIVAISWQGGSVAPDDLALFRFSASVGADETTLHLVGVQTFADGTTKVWKTPVVGVAKESSSSGSDTGTKGLAAAALGLAAAALAISLRRRR